LLRRTLPALAITLGVFVALRIVIANYIRPHYMTAITTTFSPTATQPTSRLAGSLWLAQGTIGPNGQALQNAWPGLPIDGKSVSLTSIPSACRALLRHGTSRVISCMSAHGYRGFVTYQPGSRYWAFQGIETGIFVLLAAALIAVTAIVVIRRDA
jgi:hypothetical protein